MELWPILVSLVDVARDILEPLLLDILVVVQIELAVDDLPRFWINRNGVPLADSVRAITAVLGRVLRRLFRESVAMSRGGELPLRPVPNELKFRRAFHGFGLIEIGDGIVPLDGNSFRPVHWRDFLPWPESGNGHGSGQQHDRSKQITHLFSLRLNTAAAWQPILAAQYCAPYCQPPGDSRSTAPIGANRPKRSKNTNLELLSMSRRGERSFKLSAVLIQLRYCTRDKSWSAGCEPPLQKPLTAHRPNERRARITVPRQHSRCKVRDQRNRRNTAPWARV